MTVWLLVLSFLLAGGSQTSAPVADAVVTGRVLDAGSGAPVAAAVVTLQPPSGGREAALHVLTADDGRYFFDRLAAGKYSLTATKPGWAAGAFGRGRPDAAPATLELADRERRPDTDLKMWKFAVLSGTIVDSAGEPMVDVEVRAVRRMLVAGRRQMTFAGTARTDDRGMFRLAGLVPGEYSVFVPATVSSGPVTFSQSGAPPAWLKTMTGDGTAPMSFDFETGVAVRGGKDVVTSLMGIPAPPTADAAWPAYPPSFAGTPDAAGAAVFQVASGQEQGGIDMQLRLVSTFPISGTLTVPGESPANFALHLMSADLADFPLFDVATTTADASGAFTFYGVPPGDYVIRSVRTPMPPGQEFGVAIFAGGVVRVSRFGGSGPPATPVEPLLYVSERVAVAGAPVRGVQLVMRTGPRISGRAEFVGATPPPTGDEWRRFRVVPEHANGFQTFDPPAGYFDGKGAFTTPGLRPGDYYLRANAPDGWTLKSAMWQGHDLADNMFELGTTDVTDVVVTFTDQMSGVSGALARVDGDAAQPSAVVLAFPVDHDAWVDFGTTPRRMASTRVKPDGTFKTSSLPAGDYFLIAVPEDQASDWNDPATLEKLAKSAVQVQVHDGEVGFETLKLGRIR